MRGESAFPGPRPATRDLPESRAVASSKCRNRELGVEGAGGSDAPARPGDGRRGSQSPGSSPTVASPWGQ